jgi:hypothetical protein
MVGRRACSALTSKGQRCEATPLRDDDVCFWHSPEHATEVAEARRLGGLRRRREATLAGAYDLEPITTIPALRRIVEIVIADGLSLDNTAVRGRLLLAAVQAAAKLIVDGELSDRVEQLEAVTHVHDGKGRR